MRFVVQEHHSSHLHYDFRLEMDGVLKSWAIPKEPPVELGIKRLAIPVEDHKLSYIDFEGKIPEGSYGAGTVKIWDKGEYELLNRDDKKIEICLKGNKLKGYYTLIKFKDNWLLFKYNTPS
ncbi:MAG: DNA polymerase ligase N-terminal domain-containing protein [bacterium]|nr:DNA polymerase ligase N-terminal domain-containing protein [bacterium]